MEHKRLEAYAIGMAINNKLKESVTMVSQAAIFEIGYRFMKSAYIDVIRPELEPLVDSTNTQFDDVALKILDRIFDCYKGD